VRGRAVLEPPQAFQERQFHSAKGPVADVVGIGLA
jgi:hypothetical protein